MTATRLPANSTTTLSTKVANMLNYAKCLLPWTRTNYPALKAGIIVTAELSTGYLLSAMGTAGAVAPNQNYTNIGTDLALLPPLPHEAAEALRPYGSLLLGGLLATFWAGSYLLVRKNDNQDVPLTVESPHRSAPTPTL